MVNVLPSAPAPSGGVSEVSTVRLRRAGERSGRKGGLINARRLDNRDYVRERRVRRWFGEAIIFCYRMTLLKRAKDMTRDCLIEDQRPF